MQVNRTQAAGGGFRVTFVPVIEYSYEANGQTFQVNNLGSAMGYDWVTAQRIADRYQPGKVVNVQYNPTSPSQSVLDVTPPQKATST